MIEHVLVVPTALFCEIGYFQGFSREVARYRDVLFKAENLQFLPRTEAEQNPAFKQLIPYMIFSYRDEAGAEQIFQYVRGKGMGESRLHSKRSIGVGGHICQEDQYSPEGHDVYREGMLRELNEEVILQSPYTETCVGLINDDATEVGTVHLGIVHRFELAAPKVQSNEPDLIESGFLPVKSLLQELDSMESWSSICLESLFRD